MLIDIFNDLAQATSKTHVANNAISKFVQFNGTLTSKVAFESIGHFVLMFHRHELLASSEVVLTEENHS